MLETNIPKCCEGCNSLNKGGGCWRYSECYRWRAWFREEWDRIRIAAAKIKMRRDKKQ